MMQTHSEIKRFANPVQYLQIQVPFDSKVNPAYETIRDHPIPADYIFAYAIFIRLPYAQMWRQKGWDVDQL